MSTPLYGLVMAGGYSRRMGRDKALLDYHGRAQAVWTAELLARPCARVFLSCRAGQDTGDGGRWPRILDLREGEGPIGGFLSAHAAHPKAAWLAMACDLPRMTDADLETLVLARDPRALATVFRSTRDGLPEPLCALYEPTAMAVFAAALQAGRHCPRKVLIEHAARVRLVDLPDPLALENINTPEEAASLRKDRS